MEIRVVPGDIARLPAHAIVVNLFEGAQKPSGATGAVDSALGGVITQLIADGEIKGKLGEVTLIHTLGRIEPKRVVVVGLGKAEAFNLDRVRSAAASALKHLRRIDADTVATIVHGAGIGGLDARDATQALVEGSVLGLYSFRRHVTKEPEYGEIAELSIVERDQAKLPAIEEGCRRGRIIAEATNYARDMVNEPSNYLTPAQMAERAVELAKAYGLEVSVLEREDMERLGMGALLGVAQGSHQPPKLITLTYKGDDRANASNVGFLGKGITFDSGGISIKPAEGMGEMKGDMAGGAAVMGAMRAIAQLKPKINVTGVIPATENLPGGAAQKPGDVVKAMNGKTIEVVNTDAEGRLILADALCYARTLNLSPLIDLATLTGAMRIALGDIVSGAFTNQQELMDKVIQAGARAGERIWQMPLYEEYKEPIKSDYADMRNTGNRSAGAITAAQFLAEFAEDTPWVHLDIAGTSRTDKDKGYNPKGATGVGVRTLVNLALEMAG